MYNQGYRPQPGQTKSGYYDAQGNWYVPAPGQAGPGQPQRRRASQPAPRQRRASQPPKPPRDAGGKGKRPRKKRSLKWQLVKVLLVMILLAGAGVYGYIWKIQSDVRPYLNVFLDNVSVDVIDLSGLTWEEGSQLVWDHVNQKQNGWYVRLRNTNGQYKDITAQTLGISFDPTAALNAAWAIGHDVDGEDRKDIFQLQEEIEAAQNTQNAFYSAQQSANTAPIDEILQTLEAAAYREPSDAYIVSFNPDDRDNPFTFQQEVYGQRLDTTAVRERILQMVQNLESGEVMLEPETIVPNVTVADLQKTVELRYRATTPISSASTEDRTENIRIAFSKINGMSIPNGSKFSFNDTVGPRNFSTGFLPAIEYAYGTEQWGWGGGVCQASTTVYLAAIQSGMTILSREPHSMAVSYTEYGKDATVSDTRGREIDFSFRNESGGTVYLAAHVIGSGKKNLQCEVRIYGPSLNGTSYELVTETVEVIPKPEEAIIKEDEDATYVTYVDETKTINGREGYKVDAYLIIYVDGVETGREKVSSDTYPAKADTVYVGVTPREVM